MLRATLSLILAASFAFASPQISAQSAPASTDLPAFDAATIKPPDPNAGRIAGFYGKPGGRVFFGGNLRMLIECAFNLQDYQLTGGRDRADSQWFEINAVPPETSPSRNIRVGNAEPSADQRLMLQSLLRDRFAFKFHMETKQGEVYILTRGKKPLQLKPPKDPTADPRAIVVLKQGGIADGEAEGTNTTTDYLAKMLSRYLRLPVLNQTNITGSYDYYLPPNDPENQDAVTDILGVVDRLGLKIKHGRAPIQTLVIDHVEQPTAN
ncbi:TIGR03435 family protein [Acidicapsa dinghuensis]|uniref:TIGR03435 family protein n=1 Tax=Acidicapsa dinghuensis TaxID=2218256 RepID=A0ABW1E8T5_9BACT|nr:TIGR03435 family protein [Acidicapsa dinghuensis]